MLLPSEDGSVDDPTVQTVRQIFQHTKEEQRKLRQRYLFDTARETDSGNGLTFSSLPTEYVYSERKTGQSHITDPRVITLPSQCTTPENETFEATGKTPKEEIMEEYIHVLNRQIDKLVSLLDACLFAKTKKTHKEEAGFELSPPGNDNSEMQTFQNDASKELEWSERFIAEQNNVIQRKSVENGLLKDKIKNLQSQLSSLERGTRLHQHHNTPDISTLSKQSLQRSSSVPTPPLNSPSSKLSVNPNSPRDSGSVNPNSPRDIGSVTRNSTGANVSIRSKRNSPRRKGSVIADFLWRKSPI